MLPETLKQIVPKKKKSEGKLCIHTYLENETEGGDVHKSGHL